MRTNVVLDELLVEKAKALTGIKTTRAVIDEALRVLIQLREQSQVRDLRGRLHWEGDLAMLRESSSTAYDVPPEALVPAWSLNLSYTLASRRLQTSTRSTSTGCSPKRSGGTYGSWIAGGFQRRA